MKRFQIEVTDDKHKLLKVESAKKEMSISQIIRKLINDYLKRGINNENIRL